MNLIEQANVAINKLPKLGRLAILRGGESGERAVSLISGQFVLEALVRSGADVVDVVIDRWDDVEKQLQEVKPDKVFSILHGEFGEDGGMQCLLDGMGIPYVGSKAQASALCMNKIQTKKVWEAYGFKTPQSQQLKSANELKIPFPLVVKPVAQGSSLGLFIVHNTDELNAALEKTQQFTFMMVEQYIKGKEITVGIVSDVALPAIEIIPSSGIYDYHAKYIAEDTQFLSPPRNFSKRHSQQLQDIALKAFNVTGATGWGRVDFMIDEKEQPWLIEINTIPGMTDHSLVPTAAKKAGLSIDQLVAMIACN